MLESRITPKEIEEVIGNFNQVLSDHQGWFKEVTRLLVCKLPLDLLTTPTCGGELPRLSDSIQALSGFQETKKNHQQFHQQVEKCLHTLKTNAPISAHEYDLLMTSFDQFNDSIYGFKKELEMLLMNQMPAVMTPTRVTMLPILREQQNIAKQHIQSCCIALIDIDLFNKISIQQGQIVSNNILVAVAHFLVEHLRTYDKVFCFTNETFLVCLQQVNPNQALDLVDRMRVKINKTPINIGLKEPLYITVSCGIAELDQTLTVEQSLEQANLALYLAKSSGRNNSKLWRSD